MRHLVCVCVYEGRADRGVHSIGTTGRISRQLVEPIDKAQHIRHEDVSDEEGLRQPFASCRHRLQVLEPGLEEFVQTLPCRRMTVVSRERQYGTGQDPHLDYINRCSKPFTPIATTSSLT